MIRLQLAVVLSVAIPLFAQTDPYRPMGKLPVGGADGDSSTPE